GRAWRSSTSRWQRGRFSRYGGFVGAQKKSSVSRWRWPCLRAIAAASDVVPLPDAPKMCMRLGTRIPDCPSIYLAPNRPRIQYPRFRIGGGQSNLRAAIRPRSRMVGLPQVDLAAARQPARPAPGIEARRERRRYADLRGGHAAQLVVRAAAALDRGGRAGGER